MAYIATDQRRQAWRRLPLVHSIRSYVSSPNRRIDPTDEAHKCVSLEELRQAVAPLFDQSYYLSSCPDVKAAGVDPLNHYLEMGWKELRNPSGIFQTKYYLEHYPDVKLSGVNPLYHYAMVGRAEGRVTSSLSRPSSGVNSAIKLGESEKTKHLFTELSKVQHDFLVKWICSDYLALRLPELQRAHIFFGHYRQIASIFSEEAISNILFKGARLWNKLKDGVLYSVVLIFSNTSNREGELSLYLQANGDCLYILSFTIITPEDINFSGEGRALLVSRLQGVAGQFRLIKAATKRLNDVAPSHLLFAALQGLAKAIDAKVIFAVPAERHPCHDRLTNGDAQSNYDSFFYAIGCEKAEGGFFVAPIPLPEKSISAVKPGHRIRTRAKRAFKRSVADAAELVLMGALARSNSAPSPYAPSIQRLDTEDRFRQG